MQSTDRLLVLGYYPLIYSQCYNPEFYPISHHSKSSIPSERASMALEAAEEELPGPESINM